MKNIKLALENCIQKLRIVKIPVTLPCYSKLQAPSSRDPFKII